MTPSVEDLPALLRTSRSSFGHSRACEDHDLPTRHFLQSSAIGLWLLIDKTYCLVGD